MPVVENVDDGVRITIKRIVKEKSVQECIADKIDNVVKDVVITAVLIHVVYSMGDIVAH